jgi:hypothetical protein
MEEVAADVLLKTTPFRALTNAGRVWLANHCELKTLGEGDKLFTAGETEYTRCFILVRGVIDLIGAEGKYVTSIDQVGGSL